MSYQTVTQQSYGGRIMNSLKGILAGIVFLLIGTILLFWNEGRAVHTSDTIHEAQAAAVEMPNIATADPSLDGKLVFASGTAKTDDILTDSLLDVSVNAVSLSRHVEYYQWVETSKSEERKKLGGGTETVTTYDYNTKWVNAPENSSNFQYKAGHENTTFAQIDDATLTAPNVSFGAYKIPDFMKASIGTDEAVALSIPVDKLDALNKQVISGNPNAESGKNYVTAQGGTVYIGVSPTNPKVGDVRINYTQRKPGVISLVAVSKGDTFMEFRSKNGDNFYLIQNGVSTAASMFADAIKSNSIMTWILRGVGAFLVMISIGLIFAPLGVLADVIPILGSIVGAGTGFIAILLGLAWSLVTIAVAWVFYRPLLGIGLLAAAVALIVLLFIRGHKKRQPAAQAAPTVSMR